LQFSDLQVKILVLHVGAYESDAAPDGRRTAVFTEKMHATADGITSRAIERSLYGKLVAIIAAAQQCLGGGGEGREKPVLRT